MPGGNGCARFPRLCALRHGNGGPLQAMLAMAEARILMIAAAATLTVSLLAVTLWWQLQRQRPRTCLGAVAGRSVAGGFLGGMAMVPPGVAMLAAGYEVNKYGPLVLQTLLGQFTYAAMAIEHLIISVAMAVPFVALLARRPARHPVLLGGGYGALVWLVVNSLALPIIFGQPMPWQLGIQAIWPSLTVHVIYGLMLGAVVSRDQRRHGSAAAVAHTVPDRPAWPAGEPVPRHPA